MSVYVGLIKVIIDCMTTSIIIYQQSEETLWKIFNFLKW
jgi:hypothetical protein